MKKLAARDFEDILQCSLPVFDGLLPAPHDKNIQDLLFALCTWHGLAKLRLHTSTTLTHLQTTTKSLGQLLRRFAKYTCKAFTTTELPREAAARLRRTTNKKGKNTKPSAPTKKDKGKQKPFRKLFNLLTYKLHALGDYLLAILRYGTTDNFSTQVGELEHRRVKRFYARTNKTFGFKRQITNQERRERFLRNAKLREKRKHEADADAADGAPYSKRCRLDASSISIDNDPLPNVAPQEHYQISESSRSFERIPLFLSENAGDPALQNFMPLLKDHLLARILGKSTNNRPFTDQERSTLRFQHDRIYKHRTLRINYTSYDMRRLQDTVNPYSEHCDVMVLADEEPGIDAHPYWYARVIGIFHVNVFHVDPESTSPTEAQKMDFLWVRWFGHDAEYRSGFKAHRLHRIGFFDGNEDGSFGFLDPNEVIRAVHLIPAFSQGRTKELLGPSIAHNQRDEDEWQKYYVGMFVDRDMMMRYLGGGIGHKATYESAPPTAPEDLAVENDDPENENGAENEDMDGVEATGDIGSGDDNSEDGEDSSCDEKEADYGYEDEEESEVDEEMGGDETEEVDEFSDDDSDGFADL